MKARFWGSMCGASKSALQIEPLLSEYMLSAGPDSPICFQPMGCPCFFWQANSLPGAPALHSVATRGMESQADERQVLVLFGFFLSKNRRVTSEKETPILYSQPKAPNVDPG